MLKSKIFLHFKRCDLARRPTKFYDLLTVGIILLAVLGCGRVSTSRSGSSSPFNNRNRCIESAKTAKNDSSPQLANTLATISLQYSRAVHLADKATLQRVIADDYSGEFDGEIFSKQKLIESLENTPSLISVKADNPQITEQTATSATLEYDHTIEYTGRIIAGKCTDEFVNRAGNWQIRKSECHYESETRK